MSQKEGGWGGWEMEGRSVWTEWGGRKMEGWSGRGQAERDGPGRGCGSGLSRDPEAGMSNVNLST